MVVKNIQCRSSSSSFVAKGDWPQCCHHLWLWEIGLSVLNSSLVLASVIPPRGGLRQMGTGCGGVLWRAGLGHGSLGLWSRGLPMAGVGPAVRTARKWRSTPVLPSWRASAGPFRGPAELPRLGTELLARPPCCAQACCRQIALHKQPFLLFV